MRNRMFQSNSSCFTKVHMHAQLLINTFQNVMERFVPEIKLMFYIVQNDCNN